MADVNFERRDGGIAWITLNRPESLNAMGGQLLPLLGQYLDDCVHDRSVRCVVLTGAGRAFCAGGDVKAMASGGQVIGTEASEPKSLAGMVQARVEGLREQQRKTSGVLHTMPKPTIAAVNGHAVGAGLAGACCDGVSCRERQAGRSSATGSAATSVDRGSCRGSSD
jgi:2-(1,2-epoxy-1,2-dihydrophenyl)acetyl-CoA isomerase